MPEKVNISHRGARYEIGRGRRYYGIWVTDAPESAPIDRWPETREGWAQAWTRFVSIETPGTVGAVPQQRSAFRLPGVRVPRKDAPDSADSRSAQATMRIAAGALLGLGLILGIVGLFPDYFAAQSLAAQADEVVPHLIYLAGWAVSAFLVLRGGRTTRAGALLGTGVSAVTLGLFLSDLGEVISVPSGGAGFPAGAGLVISLIGWAACAAGAGLALAVRPAAASAPAAASGAPAAFEAPTFEGPASEAPTSQVPAFGTPALGTAAYGTAAYGAPSASGAAAAATGRPVRPRAEHVGPIALLVLGAIGAVATFAPSWDSFTFAGAGGTQTITQGDAFSEPGVMIAGSVIVMVAVVAVALLSALWRPARQGAALLAGAILPMAAQAISALIQVGEPVSPSQFGISPAQASADGLTITSGVTPIFWVYCVFVIALVISCAWLFTQPADPATASAQPSWPEPIPPIGDDTDSVEDEAIRDENADENRSGSGDSGDATAEGDGNGDEDDEESTYA